MIRRWLTSFMTGRYGMDQLNSTLMVLYIALYIVFIFTRWAALNVVALVLLVVILWRMLSRNIPRRRAENGKFLQIVRPIGRGFSRCRSRMQDREHCYFKCPNCGQQMRVPKGKGRITVHCRTCGASFEKKC